MISEAIFCKGKFILTLGEMIRGDIIQDYCNREERLNSTMNIEKIAGNLQTMNRARGLIDGKLLREHIKGRSFLIN